MHKKTKAAWQLSFVFPHRKTRWWLASNMLMFTSTWQWSSLTSICLKWLEHHQLEMEYLPTRTICLKLIVHVKYLPSWWTNIFPCKNHFWRWFFLSLWVGYLSVPWRVPETPFLVHRGNSGRVGKSGASSPCQSGVVSSSTSRWLKVKGGGKLWLPGNTPEV